MSRQSDRIRVNVIGCGAAGRLLYLRALRRLERAGIAAIVSAVDCDLEKAQSFCKEFQRAQAFSDLCDALTGKTADLSIVLTPARFHKEHTLLALGAGHHVLCEKPLATSGADCLAMLEGSKQADRLLAVGMVRRFFPALRQVRDLIHGGELGDLIRFSHLEGAKFDWPVSTAAGFAPRTGGGSGGVLLDIGPHALDVLIWLFGDLSLRRYQEDALSGVESNARLELESRDAYGEVILSWSNPMPNVLRIFGTKAEIAVRIDRFDRFAISYGQRFEERIAAHEFPTQTHQSNSKFLKPTSYPEAVFCQLVQFLRAIILGENLAASGEDCAPHIRLIEKCYSAADPLDYRWLSDFENLQSRRAHWRRGT